MSKEEKTAEQEQQTVSEGFESVRAGLLEQLRDRSRWMMTMAHKGTQATVGAVVWLNETAQARRKEARERADKLSKETVRFTDELVERGARIEEDGRERFDKLVAESKERFGERVERVETTVGKATENVLVRLNVPTADSVSKLTKQVSSVGRKIDRLRRETEKQAAEAEVAV